MKHHTQNPPMTLEHLQKYTQNASCSTFVCLVSMYFWFVSINGLSLLFFRLLKYVKLKPIAIINTIPFPFIVYWLIQHWVSRNNVQPILRLNKHKQINIIDCGELHDTTNVVYIMHNTIILSSTNYSSQVLSRLLWSSGFQWIEV